MNAADAESSKRSAWRGLPVRLLALAAAIAAALGLCHAAGLREDVSLLFATSRAESPAAGSILPAGLYVAAYVAFVLLAPVLVLAAVLFAGARGLLRRRA